MQKITLLVSDGNKDASLTKLRKLGLLHITHLKNPQSREITNLENKLEDIDGALIILDSNNKKTTAGNIDEKELTNSLQQVLALEKEKQQLLMHVEELTRDTGWFKEWGDINPASLIELNKAGIFIKLYIVSPAELKKIGKDKTVKVLKIKKSKVCLAFIARQESQKLNYQQINIPKKSLLSIEKDIVLSQKKLRKINESLDKLADLKAVFLEYKEDIKKQLEFNRVKSGMADEEGFSYIEGYCPRYSSKKIKNAAALEGWGILSQEPDKPQETPTLIKNPAWIKVINPVFKIMGAIPGYREFDISFWFLLFFTVFVAMLIGDAGYGSLFLAATFFMRKKLSFLKREMIFLIYILSAATVFWGAVTGTWFGFEKIARLPFLRGAVIPNIASFGHGDNQIFMIHICFIIGCIHLTVAHSLAAFRCGTSLKMLSQAGWIAIIWSLFFYSEMFVLGKELPKLANFLAYAGLFLVLLFSNPEKGVIKGILTALADIPLKIIGSFSDVMSYIRLFAVGFATVAMAVSSNAMAGEVLGSTAHVIIKGFLSAIILFLGHTLNIALAVIGVLVHGVRLNLLEFSNHLGMEWSGKSYAPFKE
ncbi:MAG: hypothetical protein ABH872_07275 [Candidatus Omnitrophota bacterium]